MIKILPLSEIVSLAHDSAVSGFKGKVKGVGALLSAGEGAQKWTCQELLVQDGKESIPVKIWNRPEVPQTVKGSTLWFIASDKSGRLTGLKVKDQNARGGRSAGAAGKYIDVSASAEISPEAPAQVEHSDPEDKGRAVAEALLAKAGVKMPEKAPEQSEDMEAVQPAEKHSPEPPQNIVHEQPAKADPADPKVIAVKRQIFQRAHLWALCRMAAEKMCEELERQAGIQVPAEQKAAMVSSLYIGSERDRLHSSLPMEVKLAK